MIAAVFEGPGRLEVREVENPEIGPDEVLLEVGANTVCGTDVRILRGEKKRGVKPGTVIGHEIAGRIARVGRNVRGYEEGQPAALAPVISCGRCACCRRGMENACLSPHIFGYDTDGGLAEYVRIPAEAVAAGNLFPASEDVPPEHLSLAEPLACCVNGHRRSRIGVDDVVVILGSGPIGMLHLQLALLAGARTVIVSEPSEARRRFAADLGAHVTVDPTREELEEVVSQATDGFGADSVIVCIGIPELVNDALRLARPGGRVNVFAGLAGRGLSEVEANLIHYNELEVTGSSNSRRVDFESALRLIESGRVRVDGMVTHRFPLAEAKEAIEKSASGEGIKVAVVP
ncbi:MAG: alcohol dehydrogenase catalytic domain-containing protein [Rubrobacteraceae bacterium]|nr:alcohol dehydrogenase catalytic domain-containing protein [Rubrobacteraceae bacterium]